MGNPTKPHAPKTRRAQTTLALPNPPPSPGAEISQVIAALYGREAMSDLAGTGGSNDTGRSDYKVRIDFAIEVAVAVLTQIAVLAAITLIGTF